MLDLLVPRVRGETRRASSSLSGPAGWLVRLFNGGASQSGEAVNEDSTCSLSAVWCAVNIGCNALKTLPCLTYQRQADGGKTLDRAHPLHRLLTQRANPRMAANFFKGLMQVYKMLYGNGYAEIERDRRGRPLALWPIHPKRVEPRRDPATGGLYYLITLASGGQGTLEEGRMFHLRNVSTDGCTGRGLLDVGRESLGLSLAAEGYGARFFGNGAEPGGYLKRPPEAEPLDEESLRNLRQSWYADHGGDKRHSVGVLEEGTEWVELGLANDKAQFLETRRFQVTEVARLTNMPPHKLKDLDRATFSNIEHQGIEYLQDFLAPHLTDFQDECELKLLAPGELDTTFVEFKTLAILWTDHATRGQFYKLMFEMGVMTVNEIRTLENMNPIGADGDLRFVSVNYKTLQQLAREAHLPPEEQPKTENGKSKTETGEGEEGGDASALSTQHSALDRTLMPVFVDAAARLGRKEAAALERAAGKYAGNTEGFAAWAERFWAEQQAAFVSAFAPGAEALSHQSPLETGNLEAAARAYCAERRLRAGTRFAAGEAFGDWTGDAGGTAAAVLAALGRN